MTSLIRHAIKAITLTALLGAGAAPAQAQTFPSKPVTMLIPFAAGGPTDVVGRIVGEHMARTLGQPVIIENAVGAAGTLAGQRLMASAADGHVILIGHTGTHAAAVSLNPNLKYKPLEDFAPIGLVNTNPIFLTVRKTHPSANLADFVTWLKANEKTATNAHAGIGSVSHTTCLMFNTVLGVKPSGVPYRGTGPAMTDLVAGQVDYLCDQAVNVAPQERSGTIRTLAVASPARADSLPNVPTSAEGGVPGFKVAVWNAMFAPKDTPPAVVAKLNQALKAALADQGVKGKLQELGADVPAPAVLEPEGLRSFIASEIALWAPIIKASGVRIE
jgi:tripartite-type tricarboxylate transporter receptor subunit TctC